MYRGKLIREEYYKSGETKPVKTKDYTYQYIYLYDDDQYPVGLYGSKFQKYVTFTSGAVQGFFYNLLPYMHVVRDYLLRSTSDTIDGVSTYTWYDNSRDIHNSYADLPVSKTTVGPDGKNMVEEYIYPIDYESVDNSFIEEMKLSNIINKPIEQYTSVNGEIVKGIIAEYNTGNEKGLPDVIYNLETDEPLLSFTPSNQTGYTPSIYYKPSVKFDSYSSSGNLLQQHKENDISISYIWGYNDMYLIAKVENAEIGEFAYTSFEDGIPEGWIGAGTFNYSGTNTGRKCHSNSFKTPILPAGTYNIHFWAKGNSGYENATIKINGTIELDVDDVVGERFNLKITLDNSSRIEFTADYINVDEVRVCPEDAFMTTFTYDPLVGMTSQTNPQGFTIYYEYDDLGRLKYIKDHEGNVLEAYDYHYAEEP
jgi:YD repeat-containing protein